MTANDGVLIELDRRNRASLGRLARHRRYLANLQPDGTIVLTPAAVVPATASSEVAPGLYVAPVGTPEPSDNYESPDPPPWYREDDLPDEAPKLAEAAMRAAERQQSDVLQRLGWTGQPVYAGPLRHPLGAPEAELPGGAA